MVYNINMSNKTKLLAFLIISVATVSAFTSSWNDTLIFDETAHIGAGYSYIATHEYRLNPEHPPLVKDLAGLAVGLSGVDDSQAFNSDSWTKEVNGQWDFGRELIYFSGNDADAITRAARLPMLIFFVLAAFYIFIWARELYGDRAGFIALTLFAFSPTVLAHSRFVTTDVAALFGVVIATYFFLRYLKSQSKINLVVAGLAFGVAQLLKFSLILLIPYLLVLAILYALLHKKWKIIGGTILIMVIGYLFIVWPFYFRHVQNYAPEKQKADMEQTLSNFRIRPLANSVIYFADKPVIRAMSQYSFGVLMATQRVAGGNTTYFLGNVSAKGDREYFPLMYLVKEPLAYWILVLLGLAFLFRQKMGRWKDWVKDHFVEVAMLAWLVIYWGTSIVGSLNIGIRHMLPIYPFTIILVSGLLVGFLKGNVKWKLALVTVLLGWYVFETVNVHPAYLTYYNQAVGGPSGGRMIAVDSNLDWGQDLKRLGDWVKENKVEKIHLDYFGQADPEYYIGDAWVNTHSWTYRSKDDFLRANPQGGYLAVSVSFYMGTRGNPDESYAWLDRYEPTEIIGNSIYIWDFRH